MTVATETSTDAALGYAAMGWHVFPVAPGGKTPYAGTAGVKEASADPARVRAMFGDKPDANVGVACGPSGLLVVDVDADKDGYASLAALGQLPDTVEAVTPGGGIHLVYARPEGGAGNRVGMLSGVDIRADGGYIVVAPSQVGERAYRWQPSKAPTERRPAAVPPVIMRLVRRELIPEGQRNDWLTRRAGAMRGQGLGEADILPQLLALNAGQCLPPLPEAEVQAIARSIGSRPAGSLKTPRTFAVLSRDELARAPQLSWLVDGIFPAGGFGVIFGPPNGGKTFAALSLAYSVSTGMDWLGRETRQGRVLYVAAEGTAGLHARVAALEAVHGVAADRISFITEAVQLGDPAHVDGLLLSLPEPPQLIVIDTLARCMVGLDENSSRDTALFIDGIDRLRRETGAAVIVIHHSGKGGDAYRGSSSLEGAADTMVRLTSDGNLLKFECTKQKDAENFGRIDALFRQVPECDSRIVELTFGAPPGRVAASTLKAVAALRETFGNEWARMADWRTAAGLPSATFTKAKNGALAAGLVEEDATRPRYFRAVTAASDNGTDQ
jgi:hypothetical protein